MKPEIQKQRFKCHTCNTIVDEEPCPVCGEKTLKKMCPKDHCNCHHDITAGVAYCPECGEAVCPLCGCHDVSQISRVTGYLQDVGGFNEGKKQELKDRQRYTVA